MLRFLHSSYISKLSEAEIKQLDAQARSSRKLLSTLCDYLRKESQHMDDQIMAKSIFESVNSYSHKVANLTGGKKQLINLIKLLENIDD